MNQNLIITNQENLEQLKEKISEQGKETIHILADFDRTLTKTFVNNKKIPSTISILRDGNYISPEYAKQANELFNKYHPIEIDPKIPQEQKKEKMLEWWTKHFDLLIKSGLNKKHLIEISKSKLIQFRQGCLELIDFLYENEIPFVIISSSGVGDTISLLLEREDKLHDNIHIITNQYKWDEQENAVDIKKPIIHVMNKDETSIQDHSDAYEAIKDRKNVILLRDSFGDLVMIHRFNYDNLIKIGFLNEDVEENLANYEKNFDMIIVNDSDMQPINDLMQEIIK